MLFEIFTLHQLSVLMPKRVFELPGVPAVDVHIPMISFGQKSPPEFDFKQWHGDGWSDFFFTIHNGFIYKILGAEVHGEFGIITIDNFIVKESLHFVYPDFCGFARPTETSMDIPISSELAEINNAIHALNGYVGNRNYAHWWMNIMSVLNFFGRQSEYKDHKFLIPKIRAAYQSESLSLVGFSNKIIAVEENQRAVCAELLMLPRLNDSDYSPSPERVLLLNELKSKVASSGPRRKIYLSRHDAAARALTNADEIEEIARNSGFEVVITSDMSVVDQIRLFASASHVISSHGEGLINAMFCEPWSRVLELHQAHSIDWSIRRMCSILPLSYGCVIGSAMQFEDAEDRDNTSWHLSPDVFKSAVAEMMG